MKRVYLCVILCIVLCGCESLRYGVGPVQKENAWLHYQVTGLAAERAKVEDVSAELRGLTALASVQSEAFVADYGMPEAGPVMVSEEVVLGGEGKLVADEAIEISQQRPDVWAVADGVMELGLGLAGLLGGVCGVRVAGYVKQAREKAVALREIIEGNELFKHDNAETAAAFKTAHQTQSAVTRQIVTAVKTGSS